MREYLITLLISAALCYLITPLVRTQAVRLGAVAGVRARDIHNTPTARWGGVAMWASMALTFAIVNHLPLVGKSFGHEAQGIFLAATAIILLGMYLPPGSCCYMESKFCGFQSMASSHCHRALDS